MEDKINQIKYWKYKLLKAKHNGYDVLGIYEVYCNKFDEVITRCKEPELYIYIDSEGGIENAHKALKEQVNLFSQALKKFPVEDDIETE